MMKKNNYLFIIIAIFFVGCTDFLTLEPQDELIREEYWKSEGDVIAVLGTAYANMEYFFDELYYWSELRGGLISPDPKRVKQTSLEFFNFNVNEYNVKVKWEDFYNVINIANTIIKYAPLAKENDKTFSEIAYKGYLAEAYYIRSLCYFYLVKAFRDVPFILEPYSTDVQDFSIEKTEEKVITEKLISDLNNVVDNAFSQDYFETIEDKKGRITKNAFYALLAELYLWNNDFASCIEECDKINNIFLVDGEDYFSIYANKGNSPESIFELQFDYDEYETTNDLYELTSNNSHGDKEFVVSEFLIGLYSQQDFRQNNKEGDVTYNSSNLSLWKYEGNAPYNDYNLVINRTIETSDANWIFYRLSDIHLMKAEAYAELDDFTNSATELNIVKQRAGLNTYQAGSNKKDMLNEILDERARELVGEGKRWFDLVRIARRDIDKRLDLISDAIISNVDPRSRSAVAAKIKDMNSWYLPIYYNELILNKKLVQNPFYE